MTQEELDKLLNVPPWFLRGKMKLVEGRILSWGVDAHGVKLFKYHELLKVFDNAKKNVNNNFLPPVRKNSEHPSPQEKDVMKSAHL